MPPMPQTNTPKIGLWLKKLKDTVGVVRPDDYFVGHSIGCQTIMRFLSLQKKRCAGVFLVAGFVTPKNLTMEEADTVLEWLYPALDPAVAKDKAKNWRAIFSDNDECVDASINSRIFEESLKAKTQIFAKRGHFDSETKDRQLPEALAALKSLGL